MNFKLKAPCNNCPFRSDVDFPLHPGRREEIADDLRQGKTFACHKTIDYNNEEWDTVDTGNEQHCAGALLVMDREGILFHNQMVRIAERLGLFDYESLDFSTPVFETLEEFAMGGIAQQERTLEEHLPIQFISEFQDTQAYKLRNNIVIRQHDGRYVPWVGRHKNVLTWWVLESGHAVGWNESPSRGWAFPVVKNWKYK